jgi:hypothetical protein
MPDSSTRADDEKTLESYAASAASTSRCKRGAHDQIRTGDLDLTKIALYRLSYVGVAVGRVDAPANRGRRDGIPGWWGQDSNLRIASANRFYRPAPLTTRPPHPIGADEGTRTPNRRFTKPLLCQLSYVGELCRLACPFQKENPHRGSPLRRVYTTSRQWNIPRPS